MQTFRRGAWALHQRLKRSPCNLTINHRAPAFSSTRRSFPGSSESGFVLGAKSEHCNLTAQSIINNNNSNNFIFIFVILAIIKIIVIIIVITIVAITLVLIISLATTFFLIMAVLLLLQADEHSHWSCSFTLSMSLKALGLRA